MTSVQENVVVPETTAFDDEQFDHIYPPGIENHYWTRARNRIVEREVLRLGLDSPRVVEVGCGRGIVVQHLRERRIDCVGIDIAPVPVLPSVRQFVFASTDAREAPSEVRERADVLLLLDLLEHLEDPVAFLSDLLERFPRASRLVATVPACPELWSSFDEFNRHQRRYTPETLRWTMMVSGLRILDLRYLFHFLYVPARALLALGRDRSRTVRAPGPLLAPIHRALAFLGVLDDYLVPDGIPGTSLLVSADVPGRE